MDRPPDHERTRPAGGSGVRALGSVVGWTTLVLAVLLPASVPTGRLGAEDGPAGQGQPIVDPHVWPTVESMRTTAPTVAFDEAAREQIQVVDALLGRGERLEKPRIAEALLRLNRYRQTRQVQDRVSVWASVAAGRVAPSPPVFDQLWAAAHAHYLAQEFQAAVATYSEVLARRPGDRAARNNLALAQMHLGDDLAAEVQLWMLSRRERDYAPVWVNLTLVLERIGLHEWARGAALDTARVFRNGEPGVADMAAFYGRPGSRPADPATSAPPVLVGAYVQPPAPVGLSAPSSTTPRGPRPAAGWEPVWARRWARDDILTWTLFAASVATSTAALLIVLVIVRPPARVLLIVLVAYAGLGWLMIVGSTRDVLYGVVTFVLSALVAASRTSATVGAAMTMKGDASRAAERVSVSLSRVASVRHGVALCDVCHAVISRAEATVVSAAEFRSIVASGFEPDGHALEFFLMTGVSRREAAKHWKEDLVKRSRTDWLLCSGCSEQVAAHR